MTEKKITKRERYAQLLAIEEIAKNEELVQFIEHEIELLDRKKTSGSGKVSAQAKANEDIKSAILAEMEKGVKYTVTDMIKKLPILANFVDGDGNPISNQRASALVSALSKDGKVERTIIKGRAYFEVVAE